LSTCGSKSGVNNKTLKLPETRETLGKIEIFLAQNPIFLACNPIFFTRKLIFFNGFPSFFNRFPTFANGFRTLINGVLLSAMPFYFPQRLSTFRKGFPIFLNGFLIFLNGFPLSKKSEKIYLRRQVYKRSLSELRISGHSLSELCNSC
jgi:hypothetical protein